MEFVMDVFFEDIVKCEQTLKDRLCIIGLYFAAFIVSLIMLFVVIPISFGLGAAGQIVLTIALFAAAAGWWGAHYLAKNFYIEYEYILTNSEMDIDKIMAKTRRKRIISFDFKDIELCAPADDVNFRHEFDNTDSYASVLELTGQGAERVKYYVNLSNDKGRIRLAIAPKAKIMEAAHKYNPRKITLKRD